MLWGPNASQCKRESKAILFQGIFFSFLVKTGFLCKLSRTSSFDLDPAMLSWCWWACISYRAMWKAPILWITHLCFLSSPAFIPQQVLAVRELRGLQESSSSWWIFLKNQTKRDLQGGLIIFVHTCPATAVASYLFTLNPTFVVRSTIQARFYTYQSLTFRDLFCQ